MKQEIQQAQKTLEQSESQNKAMLKFDIRIILVETITREAVIEIEAKDFAEAQAKAKKWNSPTCLDDDELDFVEINCDMQDYTADIISPDEWIYPDEQMPNNDTDVLIWLGYGGMQAGKCVDGTWYFKDEQGVYCQTSAPVYWQAMPIGW